MGRKATSLDKLLTQTWKDPTSGCLIWLKGTGSDGRYGECSYLNKTQPVHRVAYKLAKGSIPVGINVLHSCDRTLCINPDHLFLGSQADNIADRDKKNRQAKGVACNHPHRVFTDDSVREVRMLYAQGTLRSHIAKLYGCNVTTISYIVDRKTWKHVL